jgi:hypothetical protein
MRNDQSYKTFIPVTSASMSTRTWVDSIGSSALRNVESLAQSVTRANDEAGVSFLVPATGNLQQRNTGDTGKLFNTKKDQQLMMMSNYSPSTDRGDKEFPVSSSSSGSVFPVSVGETVSTAAGSVISTKGKNRKVVLSALESLERDMQLLDNITAQKPQLSRLEITLLTLSVVAAGSGPVFFADGAKIAEVLAPACAACKCDICCIL